MAGVVVANQPGVYFVDADGNAISLDDGAAIGSAEGVLILGKDGTNARLLRVASDGTLRIDPTGTTTQPISASSLPLPTGAATETTLAAADTKLGTIDAVLDSIKDVDGIKKITDPLPAGTNNIGDVDVVSSVLPTGAATETTLASINTKTPSQGQTTMANSSPVVIASDQTAVASKNAAASQVDGHSVTLGATTDADTANTVVGRLKQIITRLAGGLPAALTAGGNLKTALLEALPAGTNRIGAVRAVDANDVALDLARDTAVPAGTRGLLVVGEDDAGAAQAIQVDVDPLDEKRRLIIGGKVSVAPPDAPPGTTTVSFTFSGALSINSTQTDNYVITSAKRFVLQQVVSGSEGDSTSRGSVVEVYYFDGTTEYLIERSYINGFTVTVSAITETDRSGAQTLDGNGTTKTIRVKRRRLSGSSQEVDFVVRGYEYTP